MSYILDALRKSDQQRKRGAAPTLQTAQLSTTEPKARENWIYAAIAVLLVAAGIAIGWLQGGQPESEPRPVDPVSVASAARRNTAAEPAGRHRNAADASVPAAAELPASVSPPDLERQPRRTIGEAADQSASTQAASGAVAPSESGTMRPQPGDAPKATAAASGRRTSAEADSTRAAAEPDAVRIGQLPESIRQEIPEMHVSLHLYSTRPGNSFVSIDNQMLQEGAYVAPGLKLEKITPDGMEFSFKGYRFRRGVQ